VKTWLAAPATRGLLQIASAQKLKNPARDDKPTRE